MGNRDEEIINQLKQALTHLELAANISIDTLKEAPASKKIIVVIWEEFLSTFLARVKEKGKANNINPLSLVSFSKLWKF
ncbi:hypothetical protein [Ectobacillus polymachus]|uniref:hypothetical protein n=1 Tax=Ectobacillus polymachus TaxID=1508806 RepID=UPI003A84F954